MNVDPGNPNWEFLGMIRQVLMVYFVTIQKSRSLKMCFVYKYFVPTYNNNIYS